MFSRQDPKHNPAVSILIPIFNAEIYLRECLNSVLSQTLKQIEIICINDGSTDSSLEIIEDVAKHDDRVKIIDKPNTGYGDSLNKGIDKATGEYLGIVEADDYVSQTMYSELYCLAKANNVEIVKSDFYEVYGTKTRQAGIIPINDEGLVITPCKSPDIFKSQPSIWSAIYKRSFLTKNNIVFLGSPGAAFQDTSFNLKTLSVADRVWLTKQAYVYYRRDNDNSSIHSSNKIYSVCDEYKEFEKYIRNYPERRLMLIKLVQYLKFETYSWNLARLAGDAREEFFAYMSSTFSKIQDQKLLDHDQFTKEEKNLLTLLLKCDRKFITKSIEQREKKYATNDI